MAQILHRSATTTEALRRAVQHSPASQRALMGATMLENRMGATVEPAQSMTPGASAPTTAGIELSLSTASAAQPWTPLTLGPQ